METKDLPQRIAHLFASRWHRSYAATKLRTDPLYAAVHDELKDSPRPLLDLGCGLGLLAFYLRERGHAQPIRGVDYDRRKIAEATRVAATHYADVAFQQGDARQPGPHRGDVALLDMLQFFPQAGQDEMLDMAAERVAPGGRLVIRSGVRDDSWRWSVTAAGDWLARLTFWMKAAPVEYPSRDHIEARLRVRGLQGGSRPLWGRTPFNNYLFVFDRPA